MNIFLLTLEDIEELETLKGYGLTTDSITGLPISYLLNTAASVKTAKIEPFKDWFKRNPHALDGYNE